MDGIQVRPIAGSMGAEISGIDLSQPLGNEASARIHDAFLENQVLVFHDQTLSVEQNKAFAESFGPLVPYPFVKGLPEHPEVFEIRKEPDEQMNFGGAWHTDMSFDERPPVATMLYAQETPSRGGDTLIANLYRAYETLSPKMQTFADGLTGVYSGDLKGRRGGRKALMSATRFETANVDAAPAMESEHPLVRTHPETGRKALYVSGSHLYRIKELSDPEGAALLSFLKEHASTPDFTCRVGYRPGTLVVWDNRCTQHRALNDYHGERRVMHRLTIGGGDRPS
ncbi:MAG: TauD/TfdA family dioxygenase [Alphaproteobacteria bacterium]|nr:TauD/TfdA family dioxygenase [Alphaproteobacteria bacterium]